MSRSDEHAAEEGLHRQDPTGRFTDRAEDYRRYRPGYPPAAVDAVLEGAGDPAGLRAADLGAGTGIFSRLLAERGVSVTAIEPNEAMLAAAEPHPLVQWRRGTAESTGLAAGAADLVTCAQAFHWFETDSALREIHRILRPGGRLAVVWNLRDHGDALTACYREALLDISGETPVEKHRFDPTVLSGRGLFGPVRSSTFANRQRLDRAGLLGRALSASHVPRTGEGHQELVRRLAVLHGRHADRDGMVTLVYETRVFVARRSC